VLRKILFLILGAIIGITVVRSFVLVGVEQIYFDAIIESIKQGKSWSDSGIDMLLNSDTFAKTITGAIVGGVVGLILFTRLYKK
jgi:hypothetical protein